MPAFYDDPKFMAWLDQDLKPRDELIIRVALQDDIRDVAKGKRWRERVQALWKELALDEAGIAEVLIAARRAGEEIERVAPELVEMRTTKKPRRR